MQWVAGGQGSRALRRESERQSDAGSHFRVAREVRDEKGGG